MNEYAELNSEGIVVNLIRWDGVSPYNPEGLTVVPRPAGVEVGWRLTPNGWEAPPTDPDGDLASTLTIPPP